MAIPVRQSALAQTETYGGMMYRIDGEKVPVLQVELNGVGIYFDHYVLLWKEPSVRVELKAQAKSLRRVRSGAPVFLTEARGPGHIALSRNGAGQVFPLHLHEGDSI